MNILLLLTGSRSRVLAACAVALALFLAPASVHAQSKLYMVTVGINNAIGQPPLKAVAKDALDMGKWAKGQQGKLFRQVQVVPITNHHATKSRILSALSGLQSQVRTGDTVVFYVSCHGGMSGGEFHFCAYDGNVYWSQVKAALRNVPGVKIVIIDTCHAGAATPGGDNLIVLAACGASQNSHDGSSAAGNSVYTQYLLEALHGRADYNNNGYISLAEAAGYSSAKLQQIYQSKPAKDQQFSTWFLPKGHNSNMALAKVTSGTGSLAAAQAAGSWSGSENLAGYGQLTFVLAPGGKATMHDAKGKVAGTWSQQGNQVTLSFPPVRATYHGTIVGNQMTGQGAGPSGGSWSFNVSKTK